MFVLFLFVFAPLTNVFGYYLTDLTLSPTPHGQSEFTYEKCLSTRRVLHEHRCWELLTKGPCDKGQWLVLDWSEDDLQQPVKAKCSRRRCSDADVYWPGDGFCYDTEMAQRQKLCPHANTELATDVFGDGHCKCRNGDKVPFVRVVSTDVGSDDLQQPCYPMYSRGPCPRDHVITPIGWGYGNCTVDKCARGAEQSAPQPLRLQRHQQPQHSRQTFVSWTDGRCHELGTQGPCVDNEQFTVLRDSMRPGCIRPVAELDLFSNKKSTTPEPCKTDHRGVCVDSVDVETSDPSFGFKELLRESAKRHVKRDKKKKKRTS